jgi:hypothetical protein
MAQKRLFTDDKPLSPVYRKHLQSQYWAILRAQVFRLAFWRCQYEGCTAKATEVHHKDYRNFGRERVQDCEALCRTHHASRERDKIEARNLTARNTYMDKVYGLNWRDRIPEQIAWEDFEFWLERKGVQVW